MLHWNLLFRLGAAVIVLFTLDYWLWQISFAYFYTEVRKVYSNSLFNDFNCMYNYWNVIIWPSRDWPAWAKEYIQQYIQLHQEYNQLWLHSYTNTIIVPNGFPDNFIWYRSVPLVRYLGSLHSLPSDRRFAGSSLVSVQFISLMLLLRIVLCVHFEVPKE